MEFRADLHCHTYYSDGTDSPEELIRLALEKGLSGLSITDHDTVAAYREAVPFAKKMNFRLLSGIEFSASYRGDPIHILGYGIDVGNEAILSLCARHQLRREERLLRILEKLSKLGISIDRSELGETHGTIGRPHIAQVLMARGVVDSIKQGFDTYLGEGKPAYDPGEVVSVEETIDVIHQGKGKAILAHPHVMRRRSTIRRVIEMPFDGIEGYYARFNADQEQEWIEIGKRKGWIITGGSDYHGLTKPHNELGSSWVDQQTFEELYASDTQAEP